MNGLLELVGVACVAGFAFLVFPPSALLVAGVFLIVVANHRQVRSKSREGGIE